MAALDNLFGPQWGNVFDFTLAFENWIVTLLPAALIIVATPFYAFAFLKKPVHCSVDGLFWAKLTVGILHICVNAIQAGLWASSSNFPRPSGLAALSLSCVGGVCTTALISLTHRFSFRSSSLLSIFLSITFLLGIAKSRSFFLRGSDLKAIAGLQVVDTVILATLVVLEEIPKLYQRNTLEDQPENEKVKDATNQQHETCRDLIGGFWNRTLMLWMYPMFWTGYKSALKMSHLRKLTPDFSAAELCARFDIVWNKANKTVSGCFLKCAALTLLFEIIAPIVPRLSLSALNFTMPWLMRRLLQYIRDKKTETAEEAGGLLGAFAITLVGLAVAKASTTQMVNVFLAKLRGLLSARILKKSLALRTSTAKDSGPLALLSNDVESIISSLEEVYDLVAAIPEIGVALYLLSREVGAAFFLPISTIVAMVVCSHFLALRQGPAVAKWNKATQSRLSKMINALSQIKAIKMMGLESTVVKYMRDERRKEIKDSFSARKVITAITTAIPIHFAFTPAVVVAGAIFWTRWTDGLSAITLFPTLVLVTLLSNPLLNIIMGWPGLGGVVSCFERIETFLMLEEHADPRTLRPLPRAVQSGSAEKTDSLGSKSQSEMESASGKDNISDALVIKSASLSMKKDGDALLKDVDLNIRRSSLVMVVGAVGTGKSILLRSILGETLLLKGSIEIDDVPIAFCDQQAWLPNTTVRRVIVGESGYDREWYQTILRVCMLQEDVVRFVGGDFAKVGSNGSRLSGGQKQRVSLARALYSRQPILILDDVFSALDRKTAWSIFQNLFGNGGLLSKNSNVTTILATHSIEFLNVADKVVVINDDKSVLTKETSTVIRQMVADGLLSSNSSARDDSGVEDEIPPIMKESKEASEQDDVDEIQARRGLGGKFGLYRLILEGVPVPLFSLFVFLVMIAAFLESGIPIFLRSWVEVAPTDKVWFAGLVVLGCGAMLFNFLTSWTYAFNINPVMAFNPHDRFLTTVTSATVTFLTATGNGGLLNRASQDMGILSKELPHSFFLCFYGTFNLIGTTAMVISATKYAVIIMPVVIVLVYILQSFYLTTSRQMRYLDLEAKTPLYSQLTETLSGLEHVRAFSWKDETLAKSLKLLDHSQRAVYYMASIQRWLLLMLDVLITIITLSLVTLASYWTATTSQPSIGLGLLATTDWNVNITNLIHYWTRLETSLGAAERLRSFISETPVEKDKSSKEIADWPTHGAIEFKNVTARYSSETGTALNDVSVKFETGQKVGIIGRTGSGKSSMLLTLLHMLDYTGSISIDGIEISDIPRHQLRRAMTTISQDAVELPLSIRANLLTDLILSENENTREHDEEMKQTLKRVHLLEHVESHGGLGALVSEMEFSTGQKQLFSLARAIMHQSIKESKIVLIDEATSSVDPESDMRMQQVMKDAFKGCTRLIIAHRVENIRGSDVVIEMSDGRIISKGPPAQSQATL